MKKKVVKLNGGFLSSHLHLEIGSLKDRIKVQHPENSTNKCTGLKNFLPQLRYCTPSHNIAILCLNYYNE